MNRFGRGILTVSAMAVLLATGFQGVVPSLRNLPRRDRV